MSLPAAEASRLRETDYATILHNYLSSLNPATRHSISVVADELKRKGSSFQLLVDALKINKDKFLSPPWDGAEEAVKAAVAAAAAARAASSLLKAQANASNAAVGVAPAAIANESAQLPVKSGVKIEANGNLAAGAKGLHAENVIKEANEGAEDPSSDMDVDESETSTPSEPTGIGAPKSVSDPSSLNSSLLLATQHSALVKQLEKKFAETLTVYETETSKLEQCRSRVAELESELSKAKRALDDQSKIQMNALRIHNSAKEALDSAKSESEPVAFEALPEKNEQAEVTKVEVEASQSPLLKTRNEKPGSVLTDHKPVDPRPKPPLQFMDGENEFAFSVAAPVEIQFKPRLAKAPSSPTRSLARQPSSLLAQIQAQCVSDEEPSETSTVKPVKHTMKAVIPEASGAGRPSLLALLSKKTAALEKERREKEERDKAEADVSGKNSGQTSDAMSTDSSSSPEKPVLRTKAEAVSGPPGIVNGPTLETVRESIVPAKRPAEDTDSHKPHEDRKALLLRKLKDEGEKARKAVEKSKEEERAKKEVEEQQAAERQREAKLAQEKLEREMMLSMASPTAEKSSSNEMQIEVKLEPVEIQPESDLNGISQRNEISEMKEKQFLEWLQGEVQARPNRPLVYPRRPAAKPPKPNQPTSAQATPAKTSGAKASDGSSASKAVQGGSGARQDNAAKGPKARKENMGNSGGIERKQDPEKTLLPKTKGVENYGKDEYNPDARAEAPSERSATPAPGEGAMVLFGGNREAAQQTSTQRAGGLLGLTGVDESVIAKAKLLASLAKTPHAPGQPPAHLFQTGVVPPAMFQAGATTQPPAPAPNQPPGALQNLMNRFPAPPSNSQGPQQNLASDSNIGVANPADATALLSQLQQFQQQQQQLLQQQHQQQHHQVSALAALIGQGVNSGMNVEQLNALLVGLQGTGPNANQNRVATGFPNSFQGYHPSPVPQQPFGSNMSPMGGSAFLPNLNPNTVMPHPQQGQVPFGGAGSGLDGASNLGIFPNQGNLSNLQALLQKQILQQQQPHGQLQQPSQPSYFQGLYGQR
ncbi:hypothetical protein HDU96_000963 [Phlyctochytrium bullatum]|nr:hypothetical protein HDU96_000963 [Phlyctochytrium bullatum]